MFQALPVKNFIVYVQGFHQRFGFGEIVLSLKAHNTNTGLSFRKRSGASPDDVAQCDRHRKGRLRDRKKSC
ncbi:MAG: hypothetical protein RMY64_35950 [Nostoc sp. DedQUE08]|uniref:hypothetical protein n=1 Tax=Nostoc sp. DedQUE08 TaxID=3075393 RepID=UPI002AD37A0A|nr:hypothetical protein [Nostoc sp. DedQUE08]MDZ8070954.1 hypothetical protein [Nostoc sp. DedQUE08]